MEGYHKPGAVDPLLAIGNMSWCYTRHPLPCILSSILSCWNLVLEHLISRCHWSPTAGFQIVCAPGNKFGLGFVLLMGFGP